MGHSTRVASTQQRFYQDTLAQLEREIAWLKSLDEKETASHQQALKDMGRGATKDDQAKTLVSALSSVSAEIDAEAARRFSIYAQAATTNGYGFQAYLVETKALPPARTAVEEIAAERERFESRVPAEIKALRPSRWQWRAMAQKVGRVDEYDYLYSFASKLLHATPASITTDHKNLEAAEMEMFLKYIDVTLGDASPGACGGVSAGICCWLTTACSGRRCAPPLMLSVRSHERTAIPTPIVWEETPATIAAARNVVEDDATGVRAH